MTSDTDIELKVFEVASNSTVVYEQLAAMDETYEGENKPVLLDLTIDIIEEVLRRQEMDIWRLNFHYVLAGLVSETLTLCKYTVRPPDGGVTVSKMRTMDSLYVFCGLLSGWCTLQVSHLSSALRAIDPDTAYVVCISITLGFLYMLSVLVPLYGIRIPLFYLYGNAAQTFERPGHCSG